MAVLADKNQDWRPNQYYRKICGSEIKRTSITSFQLAELETTANNYVRLLTNLSLLRHLIKHGWSAKQNMDLYRFLDTIMVLTSKFKVQ
jgi:hypothetical protein